MKETKKDLSLTEKVRIFALGGLDEDGKNMLCIEVDDQIYIIEAGIKFPDAKESLGIEFIIQDFSYLLENKDRIVGVIITHGHDDVMGALPYLLKQIKVDVYTSPLTAKMIQKTLRKEKITGIKIHPIKRNDHKRINSAFASKSPTVSQIIRAPILPYLAEPAPSETTATKFLPRSV